MSIIVSGRGEHHALNLEQPLACKLTHDVQTCFSRPKLWRVEQMHTKMWSENLEGMYYLADLWVDSTIADLWVDSTIADLRKDMLKK